MSRLLSALLPTLTALLVVAGCGRRQEPPPDTPAAALAAEIQGVLEDLARGRVGQARDVIASWSIEDPSATFRRLFGRETGERVAAAYEAEEGGRRRLVRVLERRVAVGQDRVEVATVHHAADRRASELQAAALRAAQEPLVLHAVVLRGPGDAIAPYRLASFARLDGAWRLLGRMREVDPVERTAWEAYLAGLPRAEADRLRRATEEAR